MGGEVLVRAVVPGDYEQWLPLWDGYNAFYGRSGPTALAPGLPTVAATVPGYEAVSIVGVFAPARTPEKIIAQLNREIGAILKSPDIKEKVFKTGAETVGDSPVHFGATVQSEMKRLGHVIKASRIQEQ